MDTDNCLEARGRLRAPLLRGRVHRQRGQHRCHRDRPSETEEASVERLAENGQFSKAQSGKKGSAPGRFELSEDIWK